MPQALTTVDREVVKALILQGLRHDEVVRQTGVNPETLKTWIKRYKWAKLAAKANQIRDLAQQSNSKTLIQVASDKPESIRTASAIVRNRLSEELARTTEGLADLPEAKTAKERVTRAKLLQELVAPAKVLYGWSEGSNTTWNIALMEAAQAPTQAQVTDVESTPIPVKDGGVVGDSGQSCQAQSTVGGS